MLAIGGEFASSGGRQYMGNLIPSSQLFCRPIAALKKKKKALENINWEGVVIQV